MSTLSQPGPAEMPEKFGGNYEPMLYRVAYPLGLRNDSLAVTFIDENEITYLQPTVEHDFEASALLQRAGLSSAEIAFKGDTPIAVKYEAKTDLVTLPAIFNASADLEQGEKDIVESLVRTGKLLIAAKEKCGFVPADLTMDGVAIDRTRGAAELLLPFSVDHQITPEQAFKSLMYDVFRRSVKRSHTDMLSTCFNKAINQLRWRP